MGDIEDVYADLEADVSEDEFREAVTAKIEQMGGLADEATAAKLVAHELEEGGGEMDRIADIEPGMEEVKFLGKVASVGDLRTFERDEGEDGRVLNLELADESGSVRVALWDEDADAAQEELDVGQVLRVAGRPKEGYNGLEVSADRVEGDQEATIDVDLGGTQTVEGLSLGQSDVNLRGLVLDTDSVRTFDRDDGSEGKVSNLTLGDETGRVRVTMWDERADRVEELSPGQSVEVVDGYVREREGDLELHVGSRGAVEEIEEAVDFVPDARDIGSLEIGETVDLAGVVRSADPKRTFDRDDGSEGQVRNVRVQDQTGDIRVALWGEKADKDIEPGDEVLLADVEIQEGWQDDLEASAGWQSTVSVLDESGSASGGDGDTDEHDEAASGGLSAYADGEKPETAGGNDGGDGAGAPDGESVEFTGTVVQTGDPVMLDDGEETLTVETSEQVQLGQEVTVRGRLQDGRLDAEEVL